MRDKNASHKLREFEQKLKFPNTNTVICAFNSAATNFSELKKESSLFIFSVYETKF
jgi:hypothetical protein